MALRTYRDFVEAMMKPDRARQVTSWLLATGRFPGYRLTERYNVEEDEEATATTLGLYRWLIAY
jgi:hypothetical protein